MLLFDKKVRNFALIEYFVLAVKRSSQGEEQRAQAGMESYFDSLGSFLRN